MEIRRSIEVAASPGAVWPYLVEPEKILEWFTLLSSFAYTSEPPRGVGTTFHYKERSGGRLMKLDYRVTDWVEGEKLSFALTSGPLAKDDQTWRVEAVPGGGRVTLAEDVEMPGAVFGKAVLALGVGRMIGKHLEEMLARLKGLVEA